MKNLRYILLTLLVISIAKADDVRKTSIPNLPGVVCYTYTWGDYYMTNRCMLDDVMVGVQSTNPLQIKCARLRITCNREVEEKY